MNLRFNQEEGEILLSIVVQRHRELLREIARTDHSAFKHALHKDAKLMESLLARIQAGLLQETCP